MRNHPSAGSTEQLARVRRLLEHGRALDRAGRLAAADRAFAAAERAARLVPAAASLAVEALVARAAIRAYDGRLRHARTLLEGAERLASSARGSSADQLRVRVAAGRLEAEAGDAGRASERLASELAALPSAAGEVDPALAADARRALATALRLVGDLDGAREILDAEVGRLTPAGDPLELADVLNDRGMVGKFAGRFEDALADLERARHLVIEHGGPDHPDVGSVEHNIGGVAHARGDLVVAEAHTRRAVDIHERTLGPAHLATILDRAALAAILDGRGAHGEAAQLLTIVIGQLTRRLGGSHREVAVTLNNLGAIAYRRRDLEAAERAYRRSLAMKRRHLGEAAPSVGITLNNLAAVLVARGLEREAVRCYAQAIMVLETAVAADHPALDIARRNLARLSRSR